MNKRRIPVSINEFTWYIEFIADYLDEPLPGLSVKRGVYIGMTPDELAKLVSLRKAWINEDPGNPGIYNLHANTTTKTKHTRTLVVQFMKDFAVFFQPILNIISTHRNTTHRERSSLRIAEPVTRRRRRHEPISEDCIALAAVMGFGAVRFICRTFEESGRAAKPLYADAVELAYTIDTPIQETKEPGKPPQLRNLWPVDVTAAAQRHISSKASFIINFGLENSGRYLNYFCRWINTRHPELNSKWNGPRSVMIS